MYKIYVQIYFGIVHMQAFRIIRCAIIGKFARIKEIPGQNKNL